MEEIRKHIIAARAARAKCIISIKSEFNLGVNDSRLGKLKYSFTYAEIKKYAAGLVPRPNLKKMEVLATIAEDCNITLATVRDTSGHTVMVFEIPIHRWTPLRLARWIFRRVNWNGVADFIPIRLRSSLRSMEMMSYPNTVAREIEQLQYGETAILRSNIQYVGVSWPSEAELEYVYQLDEGYVLFNSRDVLMLIPRLIATFRSLRRFLVLVRRWLLQMCRKTKRYLVEMHIAELIISWLPTRPDEYERLLCLPAKKSSWYDAYNGMSGFFMPGEYPPWDNFD